MADTVRLRMFLNQTMNTDDQGTRGSGWAAAAVRFSARPHSKNYLVD
jgi:hypothetical protein